jgi:class 3 adenylate cyclase/predicted ATPase
MQQIADWLKRLGLEQYIQYFVMNDVDLSILRDLTDKDLEKIGVLSLGHRRRLLREIANLEDTEKRVPAPSIAAAASTATRPLDPAERRQVTVMFSDLVDSTAMSVRMDPEDLREVIAAYQKCATEIVRRFDGFVARYVGDGALVYFGYPQAHEDDAERAVRAALELIAGVGALKIGVTLQTRVGIATGLVVVGDLLLTGEAPERAMVGETPNLAARLQGFAKPNMVVIAESTRRLLGSLFELQDLGAREVKGMTGPMRAWAALRVSSVASRFEALHASDLTPLVGREEEFELLLRRWARAKTSEGQVVLLCGEAGIGKSRLTASLMEQLAAEPHKCLRYFCSPLHTDSALYPIIGQIERAAGLRFDDEPQAKLDKLDAVLAQTSISIDDAALFAEMLSLSNDGRYPALELAPEQRRQRTLKAITEQLAGLASRQPVLMIFEDVHWIDATSLETLARCVDRIKALPILLIVTFRPEFNAPWVGQSHVKILTLNRLAEREVAAIIARLVGNKRLAAEVMAEIVERADGIPLFVEEMTKAVLESESEHGARRTVAASPSRAVAIPASLHASLMARLDRLGPAKEVAQIGAAIGREFSHTMLASVVRESGEQLESALDRLIHAGLLFRQGVPPHASYLFKHALVQDAAYATLLRNPRRALHARIAEILENQFVEIAESRPELLAHHCTEAGLMEKAAVLWGKAGQRSLQRSALVEATAQLNGALAQIVGLPSTAELRRQQIRFQVALANALMHTKGQAAPDTKASFDQASLYIKRADTHGEPLEDPLLRFSVLYGFCIANFIAFNGDVVCELSAEFLTLAENQAATLPLMIGHRLMGISLLFTGKISEGRVHCDQAIALYDPAEHRSLVTQFGQDVRVSTLSYRSKALWLLGYPEAAQMDGELAVKDAREIGHPVTLMHALCEALYVHLWCGNYAAANLHIEEVIELADETGAALWKAGGMLNRGCLFVLTGKASEAVQLITAGISKWRSNGSNAFIPLFLTYLARAYAELEQIDEAWRCIGEAMTAAETTKERWCDSDICRVAGELTLMSPEPDATKAEAYFERAHGIARERAAKSWELRAGIKLARLWCDQGKRQQARDLLAPIYGWFTEGFDTLDLQEARALLNEPVSSGRLWSTRPAPETEDRD